MARKGLGKGLDALIPPDDLLASARTPVPGSLAQIGGLLRSKREGMGLSLSDVQSATKIRKRYLEDIESGQDSDSPGDVYFRGFLKIYANYLGLDGAGLVERYRTAKEEAAIQAVEVEATPAEGAAAPPEHIRVPESAQAPEQARLPESGLQVAAEKAEGAVAAEAPQPPEAPRPRRRRTSNDIAILLVIAIAVVAAVLVYRAVTPATPAEPPRQPAAPVAPEPGPPAQQPVQETPVQPPVTQVVPPAEPKVTREEKSTYLTAISVAAGELKVDVAISGGPCWVRVDADGQVVTEAMLAEGATRSWTASKRLTIRAGAPWTMSLKVNGVDLGTAGPQGSLAKDVEIRATE